VQFDEASASASASPEAADLIHEIRPWREAGWIFTDDGAVTIERQGERTRVRQARISPLREE
jgi:hypothetical protein